MPSGPNGETPLNLLDKFYQDPKKYAYTFQNYVFMSRVMQVSHDSTPHPVSSHVHAAPLSCTCAHHAVQMLVGQVGAVRSVGNAPAALTSCLSCVSCRSAKVPTSSSLCA